MSTVIDRLWYDYDSMTQFGSNVVTWEVVDRDLERRRPPVKYRFFYHLRGIIDGSGSVPVFHTSFQVELDLKPPYPTAKARAYFVGTPIWHPNVHPDGRICYEDRWIPGVGISPNRICEIVGMMIAYQLWGKRHQKPVRTDDAFWAQLEKHQGQFPTDPRPVRLWRDTSNEVLVFG